MGVLLIVLLLQAAAASPAGELERFLGSGDCAGAVAAFEAETRTARPAKVLAAVGNCYTNLKRPGPAVELLQKAVELEPGVEQYYLQLARVFIEYNTPEPAVEIMTESRRSDSVNRP